MAIFIFLKSTYFLIFSKIISGCCWCQVTSVMSDSVRPHRRQPTRLPHPWDSPGKNTGVGCHFLLQCMKVKSESEVAQSCQTLWDPMDCSPWGSSIHGIFQARVLEWVAIAFSENISIEWQIVFMCFLIYSISVNIYCSCLFFESLQWTSLSPCLTLWDPMDYTVLGLLQARILEWTAFPFSRGSSQPRDRTQVSWIAGGFFTSWAIREARFMYSSVFMLIPNS